MCLSSVYEVKDGTENLVSEYVSAIEIDADQVKLTDIVGKESTVKGNIKKIDLVKNIILVESH